MKTVLILTISIIFAALIVAMVVWIIDATQVHNP